MILVLFVNFIYLFVFNSVNSVLFLTCIPFINCWLYFGFEYFSCFKHDSWKLHLVGSNERSCLLVKEFFPHTFSLMPYFESNVILCLLFCAFLFFPYSSLKAYYSVFLRDMQITASHHGGRACWCSQLTHSRFAWGWSAEGWNETVLGWGLPTVGPVAQLAEVLPGC